MYHVPLMYPMQNMETLNYHFKFCTEKEGRDSSVGVVNIVRR